MNTLHADPAQNRDVWLANCGPGKGAPRETGCEDHAVLLSLVFVADRPRPDLCVVRNRRRRLMCHPWQKHCQRRPAIGASVTRSKGADAAHGFRNADFDRLPRTSARARRLSTLSRHRPKSWLRDLDISNE